MLVFYIRCISNLWDWSYQSIGLTKASVLGKVHKGCPTFGQVGISWKMGHNGTRQVNMSSKTGHPIFQNQKEKNQTKIPIRNNKKLKFHFVSHCLKNDFFRIFWNSGRKSSSLHLLIERESQEQIIFSFLFFLSFQGKNGIFFCEKKLFQ